MLPATHIAGVSGDVEIANKFASHFKASAIVQHTVNITNGHVKDLYENIDCKWLLCPNDVKMAVDDMNFGTATGMDDISTEHLCYAHELLNAHLCKLFNLMLLHCFVPKLLVHVL